MSVFVCFLFLNVPWLVFFVFFWGAFTVRREGGALLFCMKGSGVTTGDAVLLGRES